ncbi:NUDIX domain-containing protein [Candidatus Beckwithbacteria bacterium]|nr:NUDIX domain-containing protein [Candidatus Beckwithbacteria bacterium]
MKMINLAYQFDLISPIFKRGKQTLIVIKDKADNFILGSKKWYPQNIYRFVGGGIEEGEEIFSGTYREFEEELGLDFHKDKLKQIAKIQIDISNSKEKYLYEVYLFFYQASGEKFKALDDLDDLKILTYKEMKQLIQEFYSLKEDLFGEEEHQLFRWKDYGAVFGKIHEIALDLIC